LRVATATDYDVLPRLFLRRPSAGEPVRAPRELPAENTLDADRMEQPVAQSGVSAPDADLASPFDDARYAPWPGGFSEAGRALAARHIDLVILLVGAVDAAGHAHGGDTPQ